MKNRVGLTLAEVLLSLGMCAVVILSAVALSISALRSNEKSSDVLAANSLAAQKLEEFVYALPPAAHPWWSQTSYTSPYAQDVVQLGPTRFTSTLYLHSLATVTPGMVRAVVNVTWKSAEEGQAGQGIQVAEVARLLYAR